ncbi:MAG: hypothetical protein KDI71_00450 [Xanthomonadales bacterium]|nr:hypothetical protein [Xanthomonadales bacterium]
MKQSNWLWLVLAVALGSGFHAGQSYADQPVMHQALETLQAAERQLERATPDKGGHRVKALKHVRSAIREVERGIAYDRRH